MTRAHVGISPVTSVGYILTLVTPLTLGMTQFLVNLIMLGIQVLWLRKRFPKVQYLQLAASLLFSVFIDWVMPFTVMFNAEGKTAAVSYGVFLLAMLIMGSSLALVAMTKLVLLPADGLAVTMSEELKISFGMSKVISDCLCVAVTVGISFLCLGKLETISLGTVLAAVFLGYMVKFFTKIIRPSYEKMIQN